MNSTSRLSAEDWQSIAEDALSAAQSLYLFWHEGHGSDMGALDKYLDVLRRYRNAGGRFEYFPKVENTNPTVIAYEFDCIPTDKMMF